MAMLQLSLPVVVLLAFVVFKLNHRQKGYFFKVPILISSTGLSLVIGHMASGVMGFYGAAFCDIMLFPALLMIKKLWERKESKLQASQLRALPA
jgi:hypothetical protein